MDCIGYPGEMTDEYELTKDDLSVFNLYHQRHSQTARRHYLRTEPSGFEEFVRAANGYYGHGDQLIGP